MPPPGRTAFLRNACASLRGGGGRARARLGLHRFHPTEMHRTSSASTRGAWVYLMPTTRSRNSSDVLVAELGELQSDPARRKFLARHPKLLRQSTIERLAQLVVQRVRVSTKEALNLAAAAALIAKRLRRKESQALALRAMA